MVEHIETWRNIYCLLHSNFKRTSVDCIAEDTAVRDQVIIWSKGKKNARQEELKRSWDLELLRREGMKMESAASGGTEIIGEDMNKMGAYLSISLKKKQTKKDVENRIQ